LSDLGSLLPRLDVPPPGPRSRELARRLAAVESRNVTFVADDFPIFWAEARGANVRDADGNIYIDLSGAFGVAGVGHANDAVVARIREQAGRLLHGMGDVHPPSVKVELLERLCALAPWPDARAVLACTGSEAVEIALKTAMLATGRPGLIAFEGAYHGLTLGALATTARRHFRAPFEPLLYQGVEFLPFPTQTGGDDVRSSGAVLAAVEDRLQRGTADGREVGAILVEPIQGRAGIRIPAPGFLAGLHERARAHSAVLIADEVFTGFGRTGTLFAAEAEGLVPDILCAGKALGGGLPLGVCLARREVMDAWPASAGEGLHASTFMGHPLACAAALAFLDELERRSLVDRARQLGVSLLERLRSGTEEAGVVREVRGRGFFVGIELGLPGRDPESARGLGTRVALAALRRGVIVLVDGDYEHVVELVPPLVITEEQLWHGADALCEVIHAVGRKPE